MGICRGKCAPRTTLSFHTSPQTGVAIPRIGVPFLDNIQVDSGKQHKKNGMYDDGLSGIRWRFPHQFANWFGMTVLFGGRTSLYKFQFAYVLTKAYNRNQNHTPCCRGSLTLRGSFFSLLLTYLFLSRIISICLETKELLRRSVNDTAGTAGIAAH